MKIDSFRTLFTPLNIPITKRTWSCLCLKSVHTFLKNSFKQKCLKSIEIQIKIIPFRLNNYLTAIEPINSTLYLWKYILWMHRSKSIFYAIESVEYAVTCILRISYMLHILSKVIVLHSTKTSFCVSFTLALENIHINSIRTEISTC